MVVEISRATSKGRGGRCSHGHYYARWALPDGHCSWCLCLYRAGLEVGHLIAESNQAAIGFPSCCLDAD